MLLRQLPPAYDLRQLPRAIAHAMRNVMSRRVGGVHAPPVRLHRIAAGTVAVTLALMVMGSLVHGTGSSLACPDWPLCHGTAFPVMKGGVQFEHTHRLVAAGVVALATVLLVGTWRTRDRIARGLAATACALIALQATLGALTVLLRLPPAISIAHLATSMSFLCVVVLLAVRLTPADAAEVPLQADQVRGWIVGAGVLVFVQIVLGGVVRHTGAALACPGMPLCAGRAWPSGGGQWVHMAHRTLGAIAGVATIGASAFALQKLGPTRHGYLALVAILPATLVVVQVALGVAVVLTGAPLWLVTVHHATAATTLASLVLAWASRLRPGAASAITSSGSHRPYRT
jgi:heme A synthase